MLYHFQWFIQWTLDKRYTLKKNKQTSAEVHMWDSEMASNK